MALPTILSVLEVREYLGDYAAANYLLNGQESSDTRILLAMELAVEEFNKITPISSYNTSNFVGKGLLLTGTLWKLYDGLSRQYFRNQLEYSDGGVSVNLEEKGAAYAQLANASRDEFMSSAKAIKIQQNMQSGYGTVFGDESFVPDW